MLPSRLICSTARASTPTALKQTSPCPPSSTMKNAPTCAPAAATRCATALFASVLMSMEASPDRNSPNFACRANAVASCSFCAASASFDPRNSTCDCSTSRKDV